MKPTNEVIMERWVAEAATQHNSWNTGERGGEVPAFIFPECGSVNVWGGGGALK